MNISTSYQYSLYDSEIQTAQTNLNKAQQQMSTGLAINAPSDDPVGQQQVLNMQTLKDSLSQYQSNITNGTDILKSTDAALQTAQTTMNSANSIALQAANGATLDSSTVSNLVSQISQLQQNLLTTANTQGPNGDYLFAGQKTDTQPFSVDASGNLSYSGDANSVSIQAGPNESVAVNVPGTPYFTNAYDALTSLKTDLQSGSYSTISNTDLASIKSATTALSQANGLVGAKTDQLTNLSSFNSQRISDFTSNISSIKDINVATATTNYQQATNAYQAALEVVGKASGLSLMNYLSTSL